MEKVTGNMPEFWGWVANAKYNGTFTFHEVVYDEWKFYVSFTRKFMLPCDFSPIGSWC